MKFQLLACLIVLIAFSGCITQDSRAVNVGDNIAVDYTGKLDDGTVFDSSVGKVPLEFTAGTGQMIKGFDSAVIGMKIGETKTVRIEPQDAYGPVDSRRIINVSKSAFGNESIPSVGSTVYSQNGAAKIIAIYDQNVTIDFNHELAGKALNFEITLVKIE